MGTNKIIIATKKPPTEGKDMSNTTNSSMMESYGLTEQDLTNIRAMQNVQKVSFARNSREKVLKGTTRLDLTLVGVSSDFLAETSSLISQGRWLSEADYKNSSNVCVIGRTAKRKLFNLGETNIIGSSIRVGKGIFTVVGVLENNHGTNMLGVGKPDELIMIPMTTSDALFTRQASTIEPNRSSVECVDYDTFIVSVVDTNYIDYTSKRISAYLDKTHGESRDWEKVVPYDLLLQQEKTQNIFTIVMASIAGISLLVGGIGIMNIMLANVYERRKEIGTRRALGAQKSDIIMQFLLETIFLTVIGGIIGVTVGVLLAELVAKYADYKVVFSAWSIGLSLAISALIGIVFGTYPAWKAAQQNPIDVLRAE